MRKLLLLILCIACADGCRRANRSYAGESLKPLAIVASPNGSWSVQPVAALSELKCCDEPWRRAACAKGNSLSGDQEGHGCLYLGYDSNPKGVYYTSHSPFVNWDESFPSQKLSHRNGRICLDTTFPNGGITYYYDNGRYVGMTDWEADFHEVLGKHWGIAYDACWPEKYSATIESCFASYMLPTATDISGDSIFGMHREKLPIKCVETHALIVADAGA